MGGPFLEGVTQLGPEINYYEISPLLKMKNYIALRDDSAKAPYLESVGGGEVITYDDAESTHLKCEYALSHGLKGVFMWTMDRMWQGIKRLSWMPFAKRWVIRLRLSPPKVSKFHRGL